MLTTSKATTTRLETLIIHPLASAIPMPADDDPATVAMIQSVCELGILEPLKISKGRIVDGRLRRVGARFAGLEEVPTVEVEEEDVAGIVFDSLMARRHYTKSARILLAVPLFPGRIAEAQRHFVQSLRMRGNSSQVAEKPTAHCAPGAVAINTAEQLGEAFGISARYVEYALQITREFERCPELRAVFLPKIMAGEMRLAEAIQGIAGWKSMKGKPKAVQQELDLWADKIKGFEDARKFASWPGMRLETQAFVADKIATAVCEVWPPEITEEIVNRWREKKRAERPA